MTAFLKCGDLEGGFARVRCPDCHHEMFVAFFCKQRCTCPSCHQKRTLLTALHVAEEVCAPVAHRQVVLTIPKRLRLHTRFDRRLLGKLAHCAWTCIQKEVRRHLGRDDLVPGMVAAVQTHGELLHGHPHLRALVTCGAFTPEGDFAAFAPTCRITFNSCPGALPHPLAFRWRTIEILEPSVEKYLEILRAAEVCAAYVAIAGCALSEYLGSDYALEAVTTQAETRAIGTKRDSPPEVNPETLVHSPHTRLPLSGLSFL